MKVQECSFRRAHSGAGGGRNSYPFAAPGRVIVRGKWAVGFDPS